MAKPQRNVSNRLQEENDRLEIKLDELKVENDKLKIELDELQSELDASSDKILEILGINAELEGGINPFYYDGADLHQAVLLNRSLLNDTDLMYRVVQILAAYKKEN